MEYKATAKFKQDSDSRIDNVLDFNTIHTRNLGLDIVRSIAIIMVLISHGRTFFTKYIDLQILSMFGFLGVEIFFVLSGFLIGKIIIIEVINNGKWKSLINFYIRRWFRTLPLYYLMLLVFAIQGRKIYLQYFLFLQNFNEKIVQNFGVSWSLSVEEWFYLIIPVVLLVSVKLVKNRKNAILI